MTTRDRTSVFLDKICRCCKSIFTPNGRGQQFCTYECGNWQRFLDKYNITNDEYYAMLARQDQTCALCSCQPRHVDHDHVTGLTRGVLCVSCNFRLSAIDDREWLQQADAFVARELDLNELFEASKIMLEVNGHTYDSYKCPRKYVKCSFCSDVFQGKTTAKYCFSCVPYNDRISRNRLLAYGLNFDMYRVLLERQGGGCFFNASHQRRLEVDHCHVSGKIRGIVCNLCNKRLHVIDDPSWRRRAEAYRDGILLKIHSA